MKIHVCYFVNSETNGDVAAFFDEKKASDYCESRNKNLDEQTDVFGLVKHHYYQTLEIMDAEELTMKEQPQ